MCGASALHESNSNTCNSSSSSIHNTSATSNRAHDLDVATGDSLVGSVFAPISFFAWLNQQGSGNSSNNCQC